MSDRHDRVIGPISEPGSGAGFADADAHIHRGREPDPCRHDRAIADA